MRIRSTVVLGISTTLVTVAACSGGGGNAKPGPGADLDASAQPDAPSTVSPEGSSSQEGGHTSVASSPSHGSTIALTGDDSRLVVANHDTGTATVFSVDYTSAALPTLAKLAEIAVGGEPSSVVVHPDGDTAFVLSRKDQKLVKLTGLQSNPVKAAEVAVGSEPTGMAMTPLGNMVWVANWIDGTVLGIRTDTMAVATTIDLNAVLAASPYVGAGVTARPSLAHPRSVAITNNGDMIENDETLYVTEYFAQQKVPLASDASNADTAKVGIVYKIPLNTNVPSLIELPPMTDMGFQDHLGGTAGCFPNQLRSITIQGGFGYVTSVCASPKAPIGIFTGPAAKVCTADAACPGGAGGSCGGFVAGTCALAPTTMCKADTDCLTGTCTGVVAGKCKTNCAADVDCGKVGGKCVPTTGTDPTVGGVCAPNPADVQTTTAPVVSIIDLGGNKTIDTVNLAKEFTKYFDQQGMPDDATRRMPLLPADIGFVPGTVTAYLPAYGADAVFRVDFDATYASAAIDSVGSPKNPFMSLFSAAIDPSHNGQLPSGIAVAHATHTATSMVRYAFVANDHTRNVTVLDLAGQEIAGLSAGTPTTAAASAPATDQVEIDKAEGKRLFVTGLGRWSWKGQAWQGCSNCHGDGLTDNVTWYLGRGPRQSPNLDGSFVKGPTAKNDPTDYRINSWEAVQDEIADHEGAIRSLSGGVGAIVKDAALSFASRLDATPPQTGLNGSSLTLADPSNPGHFPVASVLSDWQKIVTWARIVRSPRRPSNLDAAKVATGQTLFTTANCQGCHGGPLWTISTVFYKPDSTGTVNNGLKSVSWTGAVHLANFPLSLLPVADGLPAIPDPTTKLVFSKQTMRYSGSNPASFDQLTCALRSVGTWGVAQPEAGIAELRSDLVTPAQGNEADCKGFNPPPLLNVAAGAPYFHAGNALTLEGAFSDAFKSHHQALASGFLDAADPARADKVAALIQFVLSIDGDLPPIAIPTLGPSGGSFCSLTSTP